jgi:TRAP-type transport system periplasmic protein
MIKNKIATSCQSFYAFLTGCLPIFLVFSILWACSGKQTDDRIKPKISTVNSPSDIVTLGAQFIAREVREKSQGNISPVVYHSGVLSGGKGMAEIEMCQQGSIEIHITSTAYLANMVPQMSLVSLPFLFRDLEQVMGFVSARSRVLEKINHEMNTKGLHIIAWWPRGFRQVTNSQRPVETLKDLEGLKMRVMNNQLYVDILNALHANPVPMEWGEVYNGLQLKTIDGQENAEDVIVSNRLYEVQKFMTIWDYSTDLEVVLVNLPWWNELTPDQRNIIQDAAKSSIQYEAEILKENTTRLRKEIESRGIKIYHLPEAEKENFIKIVEPVWQKYREKFSDSLVVDLLDELKNF